ncbi:MAG: tetratricopeptide repeat protein [Candidatus Portnoybacteria bacterium]|nr:tetratricopeptide repeat protein [Candidatus Portnoybacteria bacterium]
MRKICNFVIKFSIYGLVFLMPLFWLSWTNEVYEFNKQYLLVFLVGLALLAWLVKMIVVQKRFVLRRTPLDIWILVFMVVMVLSAVFSIDEISSWFGFYVRFSDSMVGLLALGLMYFVVINNVSMRGSLKARPSIELEASFPNSEDTSLMPKKGFQGALSISKEWGLSLEKILRLFLFSVLIVVVITCLSVFGFWGKIPGLPQIMSFQSFNPVSGSLEGLAVFLVAVIGLVIVMLLQKAASKKQRAKLFRYSLFILATVLLVLIDFWAAWLVLGIVMLVLLLLAFWTRLFRERVNLLILPIILLLISIVGLTGFITKAKGATGLDFLSTPLPQEIILDFQTANTITWQTLKEYPVFGSGPGTFLANFTKFKPDEFNQSQFWNIRFDKGPSHLIEMVGTGGILSILSYLLLVSIFSLIILVFFTQAPLSRKKSGAGFSRKKLAALKGDNQHPISDSRHPILLLSLILVWLSLLIAQFVYLQNTVLAFFFWLFMALAVIVWQGIQGKYRKISFSFKKLPEVGLVINVLLLILVFTLLGLFYMGGRFYWAEVKFRQPAVDNQQLVQNLEKTVNLNGFRENYRRALSQIYLINAWAEARKPAEEQNIQLLQALAAGSIQQARLASLLSPNLVATWENLGAIYRDSQGLVGGTLPFALESFTKATELEPTNPFFFRERCRLNLISEERDWDKTIDYCQKAIDLKPNYLDAHVQLALVYEQKGDLEEAVKRLKGALDKLRGVSFQRGSSLAGAAAEIYFQLGRVYFNLEQSDEAVNMFEQSIIVMPEYANARYALALSYQVKGRLEDALTQYQIVNQLVPGNEEVLARIGQLTAQLTPQVSAPAPIE